MTLTAITGEQILANITVVASIALAIGGVYAMWAKWVDGQVKIARENSLGAQYIADSTKANVERDNKIKQLELADENYRKQEDNRNQEVVQLRNAVQGWQQQTEQRMIATDNRVIKILEDIARRNPYRRGRRTEEE